MIEKHRLLPAAVKTLNPSINHLWRVVEGIMIDKLYLTQSLAELVEAMSPSKPHVCSLRHPSQAQDRDRPVAESVEATLPALSIFPFFVRSLASPDK